MSMVSDAPPSLQSRPLGRQLCLERFAVDVADRIVREAERVRSALLGFVLGVLSSLEVQLSLKAGYHRPLPVKLSLKLGVLFNERGYLSSEVLVILQD
jgi:hypothetical protein